MRQGDTGLGMHLSGLGGIRYTAHAAEEAGCEVLEALCPLTIFRVSRKNM
jgi:hypothetical protein